MALIISGSRTSRKILSLIESRHYRILVDPITDKRDATPYAVMSSLRYWDSNDEITRSINELSSDIQTIESLGDSELKLLCIKKNKLHRIVVGYIGFSILATGGYWVYLLS